MYIFEQVKYLINDQLMLGVRQYQKSSRN